LNPPQGSEGGSEQSGRRPVVILQNTRANRSFSTIAIVPISTSTRQDDRPTSVHIPRGTIGLLEGNALCNHVRAIDKNKLLNRVGQLPAAIVDRIFDKVVALLSRDDILFNNTP
jgi:mRNA interferase MazF